MNSLYLVLKITKIWYRNHSFHFIQAQLHSWNTTSSVTILAFKQLNLAFVYFDLAAKFLYSIWHFLTFFFNLFIILKFRFIALKQKYFYCWIYKQRLGEKLFNSQNVNFLKSKLRTLIAHERASKHVKMSDSLSINDQKTL